MSEHAAREAARFVYWLRRAKERNQNREETGEHAKLMADVEEVVNEIAARLREEGRFPSSEAAPADDKALLATLSRLRERRLRESGDDR
jgi:hypothetical protein